MNEILLRSLIDRSMLRRNQSDLEVSIRSTASEPAAPPSIRGGGREAAAAAPMGPSLSLPLHVLARLVLLLSALWLLLLLIREPSLRNPVAFFSRPRPMRHWAPPPARVVISLSTMGGRAHYLQRSLPTLLNQVWGGRGILPAIHPTHAACPPGREGRGAQGGPAACAGRGGVRR